MKAGRPYTMTARAEAAAETKQRILDAAVRALQDTFRSDIRLEDVAAAAGVSVQTVLRVFGRRARLIDSAMAAVVAQIGAGLDQAPPGDVDASVTAWFDHYERFGDLVVRNLADESDPAVAYLVRTGRSRHRQRVQRQFAPQLADVPSGERARLVDALVCACDVYTWKLLRRDMGRSRRQAESTMRLTITALLGGR
ncbi:MAG: LacI family DNA-binding transcriptional regulator [Streptosporangiales bacterium]|nr:LacI family DNA-binding transcriptional regulator [Streptosporangiales bacterium]